MTDVLIRSEELQFLLWEWLDLEALLQTRDGLDREGADALLDLSLRVATDTFATHYKRADQVEPRLENGQVTALPEIAKALRGYADLGLFAAPFPEELGGMGVPYLLASASFAQFLAANVSTSAYPMLTMANARLLASFGTGPQVDTFARPQIAGDWFGTMCLSEPQAGSNLADVATRAVPDGSDELGQRYRLTGNKMWISGGDHDLSDNIVHLVLAKIPGEDGALQAGTAGISLFIVPRTLPSGDRNDIAVAGLNHKLGYRGTTNCLLNLGEGAHRPDGDDGAIGWLVGASGNGLKQMFQMMNEARLNVGLGAAALGYRGYRHAANYARERLQGAPAGSAEKHSQPIIVHADVRDMVMAAKCYGEGALALVLYCTRLLDEERDDPAAGGLLSLLTPIAKTWPSEFGLAANDLAIQVHGGYGYTRDFDVEQLWRDNRLNPIHEGTTGIQAQDLVLRKLRRDETGAYDLLLSRIARTVEAAAGTALAPEAEALALATARLNAAAESLRGSAPTFAAQHATGFLRAMGHVVVCWHWLDRALLCLGDEDAFRAGKVWCTRYFVERELPRLEAWLAPLESGSTLIDDFPTDIL